MSYPAPPVLDYAGPASRGKLRLPAKSILRLHHDKGELRITETLSGQGTAIVALLFALVTLIMVVNTSYQIARKHFDEHIVGLSLAAIVAFAEAAAMLLVIDRTWRRTVLTITPHATTLRLFSPLRGSRRYRWPAEKRHTVTITHSHPDRDGPILHELELQLWNEPVVKLFPGHDLKTLDFLVHEILTLQSPR